MEYKQHHKISDVFSSDLAGGTPVRPMVTQYQRKSTRTRSFTRVQARHHIKLGCATILREISQFLIANTIGYRCALRHQLPN
jgi:hypothetical protein